MPVPSTLNGAVDLTRFVAVLMAALLPVVAPRVRAQTPLVSSHDVGMVIEVHPSRERLINPEGGRSPSASDRLHRAELSRQPTA